MTFARRIHHWILFVVAIGLIASTGCNSTKVVQQPEVRVIDTVYINSAMVNDEATIEKPPYQATFTRTADLIHTELFVSFDFAQKSVIGKANLTFEPIFYPINSISLDAKSFTINSVQSQGQDLKYDYVDDRLNVMLPRTYDQGESITLTIDYVAHPYDAPVGGSSAINSDRGLFFIDPMDTDPYKPTQIWTQGETESSSKWFPTIDKPNERTTQTIHITVPSKYQTLSNGLMTSSTPHENGTRTDTWEMTQGHAPYLFMLAVGDFHQEKDMWHDIPLSYIVEKDYAQDAKAIFNHTPEMLTYFSDLLDYPYPWAKYSQIIVRDYVSGAMENTTASLFGQFLQRPTGDLIDQGNDRIVAHELFHHWFGDLVTCESWSNLTLNEGFANYSEYLWIAHKYGLDAGEWHRYTELQGYLSQTQHDAHPLINFHYEDKEDMFDAHSYNKGGFVLHMLRDVVGDEAFFAALNHYLNDMQYQAAEVHDLRLAFEKVTGMDLNWFFNQWFLSEGHPIVSYDYTYAQEQKQLTLHVTQNQEENNGWRLFTVPTEILIKYKDGTTEHQRLTLSKASEDFMFEVKKEPQIILLDPMRKQLIEYDEIPDFDPQLVYDAAESVWTRVNAANRLSEIIDIDEQDRFARKLLQDDYHIVRSAAIKQIQIPGNLDEDIYRLASDDVNSQVREVAIRLGEGFTEQQLMTFLEDPSNRVKAAAVSKLNELNQEAAYKWISAHEESTSQALLTAAAEIYSANQTPGKTAFFQRASDRMSFETLFPFYTAWGEYLVNQPDDAIAQLQHWLEKMKSPDTDIYTKYAYFTGFQYLSQGIDMDSVSAEQREELQGLFTAIGAEAMMLMSQM